MASKLEALAIEPVGRTPEVMDVAAVDAKPATIDVAPEVVPEVVPADADLELLVPGHVKRALAACNDGVVIMDRGDHAEVADLIGLALENLTQAPLVYDRDQLWRYGADGRWQPVPSATITRCVSRLAGIEHRGDGRDKTFKGSKANAQGVEHYIRSRPREPYAAGFFDAAPVGIAVENGFLTYDAEAGGIVLRPPSPDNRARARLAVAFDPAAHAPKWLRALDEWCEPAPFKLADNEGDDEDGESLPSDGGDKAAFLQEFIGACLFGVATRLQKAAVLIGEGANGKSVFVEVVQGLFPPEVVTAIPPHDFGDERMGAGLDVSRLNAVAELPERAILASEGFKAVVTGDKITRRRAYGREFTFRPVAGHLIAANKLPPVSDGTDGFWRRLVIVEFCQRFGLDRRDAHLARYVLEHELAGVLTWAVEGAARVLACSRYTVPASSDRALRAWRRNNNPVEIWLSERTDKTDKGWTTASALFADFDEWARRHRHAALSSTTFGQRLKALTTAKKSHGVMVYDRSLRPAARPEGWPHV